MYTDPRSTTVESLTLATGNPGKLREIAAAGLTITNRKLRFDEIQPDDGVRGLMERKRYAEAHAALAAKKAVAAYRAPENDRRPITVEDTGLYLHGCEGRPGALVSQYASKRGLKELCALARRSGNTKATVVVSFGYYDGSGEPQVRSAALTGVVTKCPRGKGGFGWDSIFVPCPERQRRLFRGKGIRTYAQMSDEEKLKLSARSAAIAKIKRHPFLGPLRVREMKIVETLAAQYMKDVTEPVSSGRISDIRSTQRTFWRDLVAYQRRNFATRRGREILSSTGELHTASRFDAIQGDSTVLPERLAVPALVRRFVRMCQLTHPAVLECDLAREREGFRPLKGKRIPSLEELISQRRSFSFDDFTLEIQGPDQRRDYDERTRTTLMSGLTTWTSRRMVTSVINGSSMPSTIGPWSLATLALCGGMSFAPADARWNHKRFGDDCQVNMIRRAFELIERDPIVAANPHAGSRLSNGCRIEAHLIARARRCVGATLKPDARSIGRIAKLLVEEGVTLFRVYDAGATNELYQAVKALREVVGDRTSQGTPITVIAGQVVSPEQAHELARLGADALVVGIGDGEMCSTSPTANISGNNFLTMYRIAASDVPIPVLCDGGVGRNFGVMLAAGGAGCLKSGGLAKATLEQPPFLWFPLRDSCYAKLYAGEASQPTKDIGGNVDNLGLPFNIEGIAGTAVYDASNRDAETYEPTLVERLLQMYAGIAKALRFVREPRAEALLHNPSPSVLLMSIQASQSASPHHTAHHFGAMARPILVRL